MDSYVCAKCFKDFLHCFVGSYKLFLVSSLDLCIVSKSYICMVLCLTKFILSFKVHEVANSEIKQSRGKKVIASKYNGFSLGY